MTATWNGSTAFITGGAQGIGLGTARALASRGVRLALADIDVEALERAKAELAGITPTETIELDVRDRDAFAEAADKIEALFGPVDLLFNNAGIASGAPIAKAQYEDWDLAIGINLNGVYNGIQTFVPRMIERGNGGYIVNTASGAGLVASANFQYSTTKFAVVGLSESLRQTLAPHRIGVSVLCPGPVDTNIIKRTADVSNKNLTGPPKRTGQGDAEAFLKAGTSIDTVGEQVVAGIEAEAMWIHTDSMMHPYVTMRMEALLASIPHAEP